MLSLKQAQQPSSGEKQREPMFKIAPVVVAMIALCLAVHAIRSLVLSPEQDFALLLRTAFIPLRYFGGFELDVFAFISLVSYSVLHGDGVHLAINMIWLATFGSPLANRIGALKFAGFWIFTSVAAVLLHYLVSMDEAAMVIGASGAVSGTMAAAARFGFSVDRTSDRPAFSSRRLTLAGVLQNRTVVVFLTVWFGVNLISGLGYLVPGEIRSIAWQAHIGGFLAGFLGLGLFDRRPGTC